MIDDKEPTIVIKKAIDVVPMFHGIWCTVGGGKPFVNPIELRRWSEDGRQIVFMLGSFNFDFRMPDDEMPVVEIEPKYCDVNKVLSDDARFRKEQPIGDAEYARAWAI